MDLIVFKKKVLWCLYLNQSWNDTVRGPLQLQIHNTFNDIQLVFFGKK